MAYSSKHERGIYCIETVWYGDEDRTSIRPMLQFLEDLYSAPYVHRDAATRDELFHYLTKWKQMDDKDYPILYLGFHGSEGGKIWLNTVSGEEDNVDCDVLGAQLEGACEKRLVHFASCSSLEKMDADRFLRQTNASAVSGYNKVVRFDESAALELLYMGELQYHHGKSLTPKVAEIAKTNITSMPYRTLSKHLGFTMRCRS